MNQDKWLNAIGVWQMAGGVIGLATFLDAIRGMSISSDARLVTLAIIVPACLLSVVAGWALLNGRRAARAPSLLLQAVQLIGVGTSDFTLRLILGPYVFVYVTNTMVGFNGGFVPQLYFST